MIKFQTLRIASVLALMIPLPAYAADNYSSETSGQTIVPVKNKTTMDEIKAFFIGENASEKLEPISLRHSLTAHGLTGQAIVNTRGDKIATVKDIIIGKGGRAILVIVSDAGLLGIGNKVAAFDYNKVVAQKDDGTVVMMLSQEMIDRAADFSYDPDDWATAKIIPNGSISVNVLLKGEILDNYGDRVADVENVYFRNADVTQIIVGFNKSLGMGGDLAALNYNSLQMIKTGDNLSFKLSPYQSAQFRSFKKSVAK